MNAPTINDGGPAFPDPGRAQSAKQRESLTDVGMSLRDYFAAQVIGHLAALENKSTFLNDARDAYCYADAMLATRKEVP